MGKNPNNNSVITSLGNYFEIWCNHPLACCHRISLQMRLKAGSLLFPVKEFQSAGVWDTCIINLDFENRDDNMYMYLTRIWYFF